MLPTVGSAIMGFTVLRTVERIAELDCSLVELEHKATGFKAVKLTPLQTSYPEFTALIGFQTPPSTHSGLPHIVEHSVLCGSDRYPLPAPFEEMSQGSLKTYLNAGTYGTFTVYPFASRCEQDYFNIMAVYLDAVFCPLLIKDDRIFQQEGWSMHLASVEADLEARGVVLSEMKGVFSDPFRIARFALKEALFEGGSLMYESGGHPDHIINLSADDLSAFHRDHYNFGNGRIAFHSTLPLEKELELLYERYLQPVEALATEEMAARMRRNIVLAEEPRPDISTDTLRLPYPVSADSVNLAEQGHLVRMWRTYDIKDVSNLERIAFEVLSRILFETTTSPVLNHLHKLNYVSEISFTDDDANRQGYSFLHLRGCKHTADDIAALRKELMHIFLLLENENSVRAPQDPLPDYMFYLSPSRIASEIDKLEFELREHSTHYGVSVLSSLFFTWLHDMAPEEYILFEESLTVLRDMILSEQISRYMRELLRKYYIDSTAWKDAVLIPTPGLSEKAAETEKSALQTRKNMMAPEEIDQLIAKTARLAERNKEIDEDALQHFPRISENDLDSLEDDYLNMRLFSQSVAHNTEPGVHLSDVPINVYNTGSLGSGIVYLNMFIDISDLVTFEDAPLIALLARGMLGNVNTENYDTPEQLRLAINNVLGSFRVSMGYRHTLVRNLNGSETYPRAYIKIDASFLETKTDQALNLIFNEIWRGSMPGLNNIELIFKLLQTHKTKVGNYFLRKMGYYPAYTRAMARAGNVGALYDEYVNGVNYLGYLRKLLNEPPSDAEASPTGEFNFEYECSRHNVFTLPDDDLKIAIVVSRKLRDIYTKLLKRHTSLAVCLGLHVPELSPFMQQRIIEQEAVEKIDAILGNLVTVQKLHSLLCETCKTSPYAINKWRMKPAVFPIVEHAAYFLDSPVKLDNKKTISAPEKDSEEFVLLKKGIEDRLLSIAAPINVNYVARGGRLPLTELIGAELLLLHMVTHDYLTKRTRLENGAYGCFFILLRSRWAHIFTYSDPQLVETNVAFNEVAKYIEGLNFSNEELLRFKIGAIGKRQIDLAPAIRFSTAVEYWLDSYSINDYRRAVGQIRRVTIADMKAAASAFQPVLTGPTVAFGKADDVKGAVDAGVLSGYQDYHM